MLIGACPFLSVATLDPKPLSVRSKGHGLILYGQSVGSGPTCYLAAEKSKGPFAGENRARGLCLTLSLSAVCCVDISVRGSWLLDANAPSAKQEATRLSGVRRLPLPYPVRALAGDVTPSSHAASALGPRQLHKNGTNDPNSPHPAGVVLHSPILSGMRVLTESRALACLDIYPNVDRASRLTCPVMVMHGKRDEEVGRAGSGVGWVGPR